MTVSLPTSAGGTHSYPGSDRRKMRSSAVRWVCVQNRLSCRYIPVHNPRSDTACVPARPPAARSEARVSEECKSGSRSRLRALGCMHSTAATAETVTLKGYGRFQGGTCDQRSAQRPAHSYCSELSPSSLPAQALPSHPS